MSLNGYSAADLVKSIQAERKACVAMVWLEYARHTTAAVEAYKRGDEEEADLHRWEAEALKRVAMEIEKRGEKTT